MSYGELILPPERPQRLVDPKTGCFLPGHRPANKGRHWHEYMSEGSQRRCAEGWKNLELHRCNGAAAGWNKRAVVALLPDGTIRKFDKIKDAAEALGGCQENIRRCCRFNQERHVNKKTGKVNTDHRYRGIRYYYRDDQQWFQKQYLQ